MIGRRAGSPASDVPAVSGERNRGRSTLLVWIGLGYGLLSGIAWTVLALVPQPTLGEAIRSGAPFLPGALVGWMGSGAGALGPPEGLGILWVAVALWLMMLGGCARWWRSKGYGPAVAERSFRARSYSVERCGFCGSIRWRRRTPSSWPPLSPGRARDRKGNWSPWMNALESPPALKVFALYPDGAVRAISN